MGTCVSVQSGKYFSSAVQPLLTETQREHRAPETARRIQIFISYPRGPETTDFAREIKVFLSRNGFHAWMDEEGIAGGANFMATIGDAIAASHGLVAIIDKKFCGSTYCNDEMAMAKGNGLTVFPIMFRSMAFENMPNGLKYMLAATNCVNFPSSASDRINMSKMLQEMQVLFDQMPHKTKQMRHSDSTPSVDVANDVPLDIADLAAVPFAVPDLPDVLSLRPDTIAEMRSHLLGFMATDAVSLSSAKSKLTAHGQGGVGKTTMAAMLVHDTMVRRAFEKIAWVSVGQTPAIPELLRLLYQQLMDDTIPAGDDANAETLLKELQQACAGKRWLIVLDDVWERGHEKMLNCITDSHGKVLVTTRIRGLLGHCEEVSLNLLSKNEAVDLLLRTGRITNADSATVAAAGQIASLVKFLPLYLSICGEYLSNSNPTTRYEPLNIDFPPGGVIQGYSGDPGWQNELVEELAQDRVGVLEDSSGDHTVARIVDTSLSMLSMDATKVFLALGVCPEDITIHFPVALIICTANADVGKRLKKMMLRRLIVTLLDRHLLTGSLKAGFKMHDIIRDLVRARIREKLQTQQRAVVQAFISQNRKTGWDSSDPVAQYAAQALQEHMSEALLADPLQDEEANKWLDVSDEPSHQIVRCATDAFGASHLIELGKRFEKDGRMYLAAKRFALASTVVHANQDQIQLKGFDLLQQASDLLLKAPQTQAGQSLEVMVRTQLMLLGRIDKASNDRLLYLAKSGDWNEAEMPARLKINLGWAVYNRGKILCGFLLDEENNNECNIHDPEMQKAAIDPTYMNYWRTAWEVEDRNDTKWFACYEVFLESMAHITTRQHELARTLAKKMTYADVSHFVRNVDIKIHGVFAQQVCGVNIFLSGLPQAICVLYFGDFHLARIYLEKLCQVYEQIDWRSTSIHTMLMGPYYISSMMHSYFAHAGLRDVILRLLRAMHMASFAEIDEVSQLLEPMSRIVYWEGKTHCRGGLVFFIAQTKRRLWLVDPGAVGKVAMLEWLDSVPAKWGSAGQGLLIDSTPGDQPGTFGGDCADVWESLECYEQAIVAAEADITNWPTHPLLLTQSWAAVGRCQAKLGHIDKAMVAFEAAIAEAHRCELPFAEMLAHRDYIVSVLDAQGKREQQMAALGQCVSAMALQPSEYTAMLGSGIDAAEVVDAWEKQQDANLDIIID